MSLELQKNLEFDFFKMKSRTKKENPLFVGFILIGLFLSVMLNVYILSEIKDCKAQLKKLDLAQQQNLENQTKSIGEQESSSFSYDAKIHEVLSTIDSKELVKNNNIHIANDLIKDKVNSKQQALMEKNIQNYNNGNNKEKYADEMKKMVLESLARTIEIQESLKRTTGNN